MHAAAPAAKRLVSYFVVTCFIVGLGAWYVTDGFKERSLWRWGHGLHGDHQSILEMMRQR